MTPIAMLIALLGSAVAVFAAAARPISPQLPSVTSVPVTATANTTESAAALMTPGPPVIILDTAPDENATMTELTTTLDDGQVITGTFKLETMSDYTDLAQHMTVTTTTSYTNSDGSVEVAIVVGIVMAGGAIWMLVNFLDAAGVFIETLEEIAEDEVRCPSLPPTCPRFDCLGLNLGFCLVPGALFGCVCEKDSCPDPQLFCYECEGKDNLCQSGDYEGCDCTVEKCPGGTDSLKCDDCGHDGEEYGVCDGISHQGYRYKGCECIGLEDAAPLPAKSDEELDELAEEQAKLPKWDGNFALSDWSQVTCQRAADWVPQNSDAPSVAVQAAYFCALNHGHILRRAWSGDEPYGLTTVSEEVGFWTRAEYRGGRDLAGVYQGGQCPGEVQLNSHECSRLLKEGMEKCYPSRGDAHGHTVFGRCITYSVVVDRDEAADSRSPPWKRLPEDVRWGTCGRNEEFAHVMVSKRFFQHIYPAFCSYGGGLDLDLDASAFVNTISVPESIEAPGPWDDAAAIYWFRFSRVFKAGKDSKSACTRSCTQAYNALSKGPCGRWRGRADLEHEYYMAPQGQIDDGCSYWKYEISM